MNYKRWADKPAWSLEEAAALLLQRGPSVVNIRSLGLEDLRLLEGPVDISYHEVQFGSGLEEEFALLLARMVDSVAAGTLTSDGTSVTPADLIFWAARRRDLIGPLTRSLVESVGVKHLDDQIDRYEVTNRRSLLGAADYLTRALHSAYTIDRILDLGVTHEIGIAILVDGLQGPNREVRYIHRVDLEAFKSYAFSSPVSLHRALLYLEDALVGPKHYRDPVREIDDHGITVNSLADLFTSQHQLDRYIEGLTTDVDVPVEVSDEGNASPTMSAREVRKGKTQGYWEDVVRPVYREARLRHPGKFGLRQAARLTEKKLVEQGDEPRGFETIRKYARDHNW
jgi:hypothetical protein